MNRCLALVFALFLTLVTVSSTCIASPSEVIHFTLQPESGNGAEIHADFRDPVRDQDHSSWSTGFRPSELIGLDVSGFRGAGTRPLRFALVREAGRLDCAGNGGNGFAAGDCSFTADPGFTQLLVSRGIGQPSRDQALGLMAVNARREMIDAIAAAHYPTPTIDDVMAMSALGVSGQYIGELARAGYRPQAIHSLIEFKALAITPEWIGGLARIGYANVPAQELVQLKALGVTPDFISGFERIGYPHLPVGTLVQFKALGITPEFDRSAVGQRSAMPPVDELVQMKLFGSRR